jgi:hypothetical protein
MEPESLAFQKQSKTEMRQLHLAVLSLLAIRARSFFLDLNYCQRANGRDLVFPTSEGIAKVLLLCALGYLWEDVSHIQFIFGCTVHLPDWLRVN